MTLQPDRDVKDYLIANIVSLSDSNVLVGPIEDKGNRSQNRVFVQNSGGPIPQRTMGRIGELRSGFVNIFIRNKNWLNGRNLSDEIFELLSKLNSVSGYEDVDLQQSTPTDIGVTEKDVFLFALTVRLRWNASTV